MRRVGLSSVAFALAVFACIGELSSAPLPVCEEGCVQGLCSSYFFSAPGPLSMGPRFPVMRELETDDCVSTSTDSLGRTTDYLCFGAADTHVVYWGDTELPQTIIQIETIQDGAVVQELRFEMEWDEFSNLLLERVRTYWNGTWNGSDVSYETVVAEDGSVAEIHERTRWAEADGPEESGNHSQSFFTDDGVERAHRIEYWNASAQMTREELRAGIAEATASESLYAWSGALLLSVATTRLVEDASEMQPGCTKPDPLHILCTAELTYDDDGQLISFVDAGVKYVVSDKCCGNCVPE